MVRNLIRLVPFEPLSIFSRNNCPWHDRWSQTRVVLVHPARPSAT
jgi:hypothetical protein